MNAPDRAAVVREFYAANRQYFVPDVPEGEHDNARRRSLPALITHLADPRWGVLVKTDRNNKIPCDVLVWRDTGEHFDVCDSQGGIWGAHGPISVNGGDAWFWAPASVVNPSGDERALQPPPYASAPVPDPGTPPAPPPAPVDLSPVLARLDILAEQLARLEQKVGTPAPTVTFPVYEGVIDLGWAGRRSVKLEPK